jgi:hypothetical protein
MILHIMQVSSSGDEDAGENRALIPATSGDVGILCDVSLFKASSMPSSHSHSCCFGETLDLVSPGSGDGCTSVSLYLLGALFLEQLLDGGGKRWSGVDVPRR